MDYLIHTYDLIRVQRGKMNKIQRVNVDTHKMMKFIVSKNINNSRYDTDNTVINAIAK
jgi:hypothetical protein